MTINEGGSIDSTVLVLTLAWQSWPSPQHAVPLVDLCLSHPAREHKVKVGMALVQKF